MVLILVLFFFDIMICINFIYFIFNGEPFSDNIFFRIIEICSVVIAPLVFLALSDIGEKNDCCSDSAVFSPEHSVGIYLLIFACMACYMYASFRKGITTPVGELFVFIFLFLGIALNILIAVQVDSPFFWIPGNVPVVILFLMVLVRNIRWVIGYFRQLQYPPSGRIQRFAKRVLLLPALVRCPVLLLLLLPVLALFSLFLLIFGQQPDSLIRAFTDTYKHGFSQLDHLCDNVDCGDHFLCSVAAKGHPVLVRPKRIGYRHGQRILCNRQLLVANAFEELIQERLPVMHRLIRKRYDKVGDLIHRYYGIFNLKIVADIVYVLMKPLEWCFLIVLYSFDRQPENRIARQYTGSNKLI